MKQKILMVFILILGVFSLGMNSVEASYINIEDKINILDTDTATDDKYSEHSYDFSHLCQQYASSLRIGGYFIIILEIVLPIIVIVNSSLRFAKSVTAGTFDELKTQFMKLLSSLIMLAVIFLIPTLVFAAFNFVGGYNSNDSDARICMNCLFKPRGSVCSQYANSTDSNN